MVKDEEWETRGEAVMWGLALASIWLMGATLWIDKMFVFMVPITSALSGVMFGIKYMVEEVGE